MPNPECPITQQSDEMFCSKCGLRWDVNEFDEPECGDRFEPVEIPGHNIVKDIFEWADGTLSDLGTEIADRVPVVEAELAGAIAEVARRHGVQCGPTPEPNGLFVIRNGAMFMSKWGADEAYWVPDENNAHKFTSRVLADIALSDIYKVSPTARVEDY